MFRSVQGILTLVFLETLTCLICTAFRHSVMLPARLTTEFPKLPHLTACSRCLADINRITSSGFAPFSLTDLHIHCSSKPSAAILNLLCPVFASGIVADKHELAYVHFSGILIDSRLSATTVRVSNTISPPADLVFQLPSRVSVGDGGTKSGTAQVLSGSEEASNTPSTPTAVNSVASVIAVGQTVHYTASGFSGRLYVQTMYPAV
ncbi:hypothetical protein GLOTRDRAFT_97055 [Gloeophyllum trabeum ATCC 11539]|uniref:Uncharacterized protein n=1 Tax=Gloeophyllum trabeum (strain ATCC 11539 / FP-39264 / Madison 617) TaxID=670483 RepID=S7PSQ1_GLOTA|nr:uncharacterized protein GLOTRDRAFT_97055 [Gloeophyllum trabeum ATCC 11539]EPQ50443.1 hypothetical protein GLOTRDRAFT_97055 [Gloeophyllum trabeum ATCC 11539]